MGINTWFADGIDDGIENGLIVPVTGRSARATL
jgi:hypothetical protein